MSETPENDQLEDDDLQLARDALLVYRHLGTAAGRRKLGSPSAKVLFDWASSPENLTDFLKNIVPKAQDTIAKHRRVNAEDAVVQAEKKPVAELKAFLFAAIEESQKIMPDAAV